MVLHRAVTGTTERFLGVLIKQYAAAFPFWLAPQQIVLIPISERDNAYAEEICEKIKAADFRAEIDARNEKMAKRIRESEVQKIPDRTETSLVA